LKTVTVLVQGVKIFFVLYQYLGNKKIFITVARDRISVIIAIFEKKREVYQWITLAHWQERGRSFA
jgi:hypothetical protein